MIAAPLAVVIAIVAGCSRDLPTSVPIAALGRAMSAPQYTDLEEPAANIRTAIGCR